MDVDKFHVLTLGTFKRIIIIAKCCRGDSVQQHVRLFVVVVVQYRKVGTLVVVVVSINVVYLKHATPVLAIVQQIAQVFIGVIINSASVAHVGKGKDTVSG